MIREEREGGQPRLEEDCIKLCRQEKGGMHRGGERSLTDILSSLNFMDVLR